MKVTVNTFSRKLLSNLKSIGINNRKSIDIKRNFTYVLMVRSFVVFCYHHIISFDLLMNSMFHSRGFSH